jgi:hypothetical protein
LGQKISISYRTGENKGKPHRFAKNSYKYNANNPFLLKASRLTLHRKLTAACSESRVEFIKAMRRMNVKTGGTYSK